MDYGQRCMQLRCSLEKINAQSNACSRFQLLNDMGGAIGYGLWGPARMLRYKLCNGIRVSRRVRWVDWLSGYGFWFVGVSKENHKRTSGQYR